MAEGELAYSAEHVERLLQCPVCLDRFKKPKLLPCQHTFCLSPCLEGLVNCLTRTLRCPECRADHEVARRAPSQFPNNLTIIGFLDLPSIPGDRANAGAAAAPARDVPRHAAGSTASHSSGARRGPNAQNSSSDAAGTERDGPGAGAGRGGGGCTACHTEARLVRCSHCDRLLCEACKAAHMDIVQADVNRLVNQVRRALPHITEQVNQIGHRGAQLQGTCQGLKTEITDAVDKHVRELKTRERLLHDDVDAFLVGELRVLRSHQEVLEVELASMASFCDSTESSLSRTHPLTDGDLVEMKRQCVENMETLRNYEAGTLRPPVVRHIQLAAESQFLSTSISNFGDLITTSGSSTVQPGNVVTNRPGDLNHRTPTLQAASDLAMSLWSSPTSPQAPSAAHQYALSLRNARSAHGNLTDEDLFEEEADTVPEPPPHARRRCRRQSSDARAAGVARAMEDLSISRQIRSRLRRHRRQRLTPSADDNSDHAESSPERDIMERGFLGHRRTRAFQARDADTPEAETTQSLAFAAARPARRFVGSLDTPEPEGSSEPSQSSRGEASSFLTAPDNSPSMYVSTARNKYGQKGQATTCLGERGNGQCQFTWPRGVGMSPLDDHIFVADSSNHRVQVFDSSGVYLRTFGRYGQAEGEFDCLAGITVSGLGQVIIADRYNHRVQIFDRHGQFQRSFGSEGTNDGELNYPWGVACDNMGFIYVCDKENHRIQVFQSNGAFVRKFGRLGKGRGQFDNPHYVAVSPDNKVYVSDSSNHRVQVFSIYGDFLFSFGLTGTLRGQMKFPRGIAIDNQGFVVLADSGNNRIQVFRADGRYFSMFGGWGSENGQFKGIEGVAILANGNVVVSDRENHRIQIF